MSVFGWTIVELVQKANIITFAAVGVPGPKCSDPVEIVYGVMSLILEYSVPHMYGKIILRSDEQTGCKYLCFLASA